MALPPSPLVQRMDHFFEDLALVLSPGSHATEWMWSSSLPPDLLAAELAKANCRPGLIAMQWREGRGRSLIATHDVRRGDLILSVKAHAYVPLLQQQRRHSESLTAAAHLLAGLGFDVATLELALAAVETEGCRSLILSFSRPASPPAHELKRLEVELRRLLSATNALPAAMVHSGGGSSSGRGTALLLDLLLRVKSNLHRVLDDETASRSIGLGLYPAACLLNHSCLPNACLSYSEAGQTVQVRAQCDIPAGMEVTTSYLSEEAGLYASFPERRALLRAAHGFDATDPPERRAAEAAAGLGAAAAPNVCPDELFTLTRRVQEATTAAQRAISTGTPSVLDAATDDLLALIDRLMASGMHPFHALPQEAHVALLAVARALDDPTLVARAALHLLTAREALVPRGTLHLASLYAAHGGAIARLLAEGVVPVAERLAARERAVASLRAAQKIRTCCLGQGHPFARATSAALQRLEKS